MQRIQSLREQYPRWGREKLGVLLAREGIILSARSIDRVIQRLKARGVLREPLQPRKAVRWRQERLRRPSDLAVGHPGALVQSDGDAEFLKDFGSEVKEPKLIHYSNRSNYPQGNGCIEWSLRTDDEEFYQVEVFCPFLTLSA